MPSCTCTRCGYQTNSAVSDFWTPLGLVFAYGCYARVENDVWVKGCEYEHADPFTKSFVGKLLGKSTIPTPEQRQEAAKRFMEDEK